MAVSELVSGPLDYAELNDLVSLIRPNLKPRMPIENALSFLRDEGFDCKQSNPAAGELESYRCFGGVEEKRFLITSYHRIIVCLYEDAGRLRHSDIYPFKGGPLAGL